MQNAVKLLAAAAILFAQHQPAVVAGVSPSQERVVRRIAEKRDWLAAARLCPADVMPKRESIIDGGDNHCNKPPYETCLQECEGGDAGACYWLAYELQQHEAPSEIYEALFQRSCKLGVTSGCTNHAAGLLTANHDVPTHKCTARTFQLACEYDDPWACTMYAAQLSSGNGVAKDEALALKILDKSCKYGDSDPACRSAKGLRQEILSRQSKKKPSDNAHP